MRFSLQYRRDLRGNHLEVKVQGDEKQLITNVATSLDDFVLASDAVLPPAVHYERSFRQAGEASPGRPHTLVVTAADQGRNEEVGVKKWEDEA